MRLFKEYAQAIDHRHAHCDSGRGDEAVADACQRGRWGGRGVSKESSTCASGRPTDTTWEASVRMGKAKGARHRLRPPDVPYLTPALPVHQFPHDWNAQHARRGDGREQADHEILFRGGEHVVVCQLHVDGANVEICPKGGDHDENGHPEEGRRPKLCPERCLLDVLLFPAPPLARRPAQSRRSPQQARCLLRILVLAVAASLGAGQGTRPACQGGSGRGKGCFLEDRGRPNGPDPSRGQLVGQSFLEGLFLEREGSVRPKEEGEDEGKEADGCVAGKNYLVGESELVPEPVENEEDEEGEVKRPGDDARDSRLACWIQIGEVDDGGLDAGSAKGDEDDGGEVGGEGGGGGGEEHKAGSDQKYAQRGTKAGTVGIQENP